MVTFLHIGKRQMRLYIVKKYNMEYSIGNRNSVRNSLPDRRIYEEKNQGI